MSRILQRLRFAAAVLSSSGDAGALLPIFARSAAVDAAGTSLAVHFNRAASSGHGGFSDLNAPGADPSLTYASGGGTRTLTYTIGRTILQGESPLTLDCASSNITDSGGNTLADFTALAVTNGSAVAPVADFTADDTTPDVDATVTLTYTGTGTPTARSVNWGDGTTNSSLTHAYAAAGTYTIAYTASYSGAADSTKTRTGYITVSDPPSTLADGGLSLWKLGEATAANRNDSIGSNTLTDLFSSVTQVAGLDGNAAGFDGASVLRCFSPTVDWSGDFTMFGRVKIHVLPAPEAGLVCFNDDNTGMNVVATVYWNGSNASLHLGIRKPDNSTQTDHYLNILVPDLDTWYYWRVSFRASDGAMTARWVNIGSQVSIATVTPDNHTTGIRSTGARLHVGAFYHGFGFLNGALDECAVYPRLLTTDEDDTLAAGGAGAYYPFSSGGGPPPAFPFTVEAGEDAIAEGAPLPLWLGPDFPYWASVNADGSDLRVTVDDVEVTTWVEKIDKGNEYARLWFASPAVAADGTASVSLTCGDSGASPMAGAYDDLFDATAADGDTEALFLFTEGSGSSAASTVGGYSATLNGSPTWATTPGGSFRLDDPAARFADSSRYLTLDGTDDYLTLSGLWDAPPAEGCVEWWFKIPSTPYPPTTGDTERFLLATGSSTNNLTVSTRAESGKQAFRATITNGGTAHVVELDFLGFPAGPPWLPMAVSWGADGLSLWGGGIRLATSSYTGAWGSGGTRTTTIGATRLGGSASNFLPGIIAEVRFQNAGTDRTAQMRRLNRGGLSLSDYEFSRWQLPSGQSTPELIAPYDVRQSTNVAEMRPVLRSNGTAYAIHSGGILDAGLWAVTSTDGLTWTPLANGNGGLVIGTNAGAGGYTGYASRSDLFIDDDGTWYLSWGDATAEGAQLRYATSDDEGETWAYQDVLLSPDATYLGWANHGVRKRDGTYEWLIEYRASGGTWESIKATSPAFTGPFTFDDSGLVLDTLQQGTGNFSAHYFWYDSGFYYTYFHAAYWSNLPSSIHKARSRDLLRWELLAGGDPVIDLGKPNVTLSPIQDQYADAHVLEIGGNLILYCSATGNGGQGSGSKICAFVRAGATLTDLAVEYPRVVPT